MPESDIPPVLQALAGWMRGREPAVRARVEIARAGFPYLGDEQVADQLLKEFRGRVIKTGAVTSAIGVIPGLSTLVELGALGAQGAYAIKQEIEMVMAIAIAYGHDLSDSQDRLIEVLAVAGLVTGSNLVRDRVLVEGGKAATQRGVTRAAASLAGRTGGRLASRAVGGVGRLLPLGVGVAIGVGFDYASVTGLGKAAMRYYGPGGPGSHVELPRPAILELPPAQQS